MRGVRASLTKVLPSFLRKRARSRTAVSFWIIVFVFLAVIVSIPAFIVSDVSVYYKLPQHLRFDPFYYQLLAQKSNNTWYDMTYDRRKEIQSKKLISLSTNLFRSSLKTSCIQREDYLFELLRLLGIDPYTIDKISVFDLVIGAKSAIGRRLVEFLQSNGRNVAVINSPQLFDFSSNEFQKLVGYIRIENVYICESVPEYRHSPTEEKEKNARDNGAFFDSLLSWIKKNSIDAVHLATPGSYTSKKIRTIDVPYTYDPEISTDSKNVLFHTAHECQVNVSSTVYADPNAMISQMSTKDMVASLFDQSGRLKSSPQFISGQSTVQETVSAIANRLNCTVSFHRRNTSTQQSNLPWVDSLLSQFTPTVPSTPYLSIVVVGRHDGFSAGFEKRSQNFLDSIANSSLRVPLASFELVFVDYATPKEKLPLRSVFNISDSLKPKIRFIEVPIEAHVHLNRRMNASMSFYEYIAKNIGIRRSKGQFVLTTNPDNLYSADFFDSVEREEFTPGVLYRTNRWSGNEDTEKKFTANELRLALDTPWNIGHFDVKSRCPSELRGTTWHLSSSSLIDDAWPCGAGDFLMASRSVWEAVQGFNEYPGNANVDAVFIGRMMKFVPGYVRTILRTPIIHQYHPRQNIFRPSLKEHEDRMKEYACRATSPKIRVYDTKEPWGLGNRNFTEYLYKTQI